MLAAMLDVAPRTRDGVHWQLDEEAVW